MLLKEFYSNKKMIVIDFANKSGSLWEEVEKHQVSEWLRNSKGGGTALVDGKFLRSCINGATYNKFFKRSENSIFVECDNDFKNLIQKYDTRAALQYYDDKKFVYQINIREIVFDDIKVILLDEIEKYREDIEQTLKNCKWSCRVLIDAKPDELILTQLQENKSGYISVNDIKTEDITKIYYEFLIK